MKQNFSTAWKSSKQPRKQRKYAAKAPIHIKRKLLSVNLSKDLRKKYGRRNIPVRKGDTVKVMKGKFNKKQGKVISVEIKKSKIKIEEISIKKMDGSKVNVKIHPSNLQIVELNMDDKRRMENNKEDAKSKETKSEEKRQ